MNRKGQLGQIITSFPVLFILLIIMIIFFVVAGVISTIGGTEESVSVYGIEETNSRILLEMFLGDYVLVDGKKMEIENEILKLKNVNDFERKKLSNLIASKFHEKYSCNGNNEFAIGASTYVNNPKITIQDTLGSNLNEDPSSNFDVIEFKDMPDYSFSSPGSITKLLENALIVYARGNIRC